MRTVLFCSLVFVLSLPVMAQSRYGEPISRDHEATVKSTRVQCCNNDIFANATDGSIASDDDTSDIQFALFADPLLKPLEVQVVPSGSLPRVSTGIQADGSLDYSVETVTTENTPILFVFSYDRDNKITVKPINRREDILLTPIKAAIFNENGETYYICFWVFARNHNDLHMLYAKAPR